MGSKKQILLIRKKILSVGFQKGHKLSVGYGRPKGRRNYKQTIQDRLTQFLLGNVEDLQREYDRDMSTSQKIRLFEVLLPFASPKLQATAISQFERLDDDTLDTLVDSLKQKVLEDKKTIQIKSK